MLSDESSSDSETGRFKCWTKPQDEKSKSGREDSFRSSARSRPSDSGRFRRELERPSRDDKDRYARDSNRYPRDSNRFSRRSPIRRHSRERSSGRRSHERHRHDRDSKGGAKPRRRSNSREKKRSNSREKKRSNSRERKKSNSRERKKSNSSERKKSNSKERKRSNSRERKRSISKDTSRDNRMDSKPRSHRSPERKRDFKEEIKRSIMSIEKSEEKPSTKNTCKDSVSPDLRGKRSEVYVPPPTEMKKAKVEIPIVVEENSDGSEEVQPGSYYSMIPAVIKEKSEESSEIDSSDDEKLRAKLLNLEKELHKTKKKKHKKKHKKKQSRSKDREQEAAPAVVEVSSTTDIPDNGKNDENDHSDVVEVSSTQKNSQKESGEEGEILSDDDSQNQYEIDPNDLRHKLKRSLPKADVCGPALPPHLEIQDRRSKSPKIEGPALPPHLKKKSKNIGPSIPDDMRKVLSESVSKYVSSDEEDGIGPLPVGAEEKWSEAHQRLEERALDMKIRKLDGHSLNKSDVKSREEWMLKLPEGKAKYLGLEARSFRAKAGPDMSDRSSWTDTPEEKARKEAGIEKEVDMDTALRKDARARLIANRDDEQEDAVKKHKKKHKRDESLLEIHEKKLKKKKKKEEKDEDKKERRPFSRDVDLQVNRFDEAQKKSIIKKAQALDTRFSRGEAKYL